MDSAVVEYFAAVLTSFPRELEPLIGPALGPAADLLRPVGAEPAAAAARAAQQWTSEHEVGGGAAGEGVAAAARPAVRWLGAAGAGLMGPEGGEEGGGGGGGGAGGADAGADWEGLLRGHRAAAGLGPHGPPAAAALAEGPAWPRSRL